MFNKKELRKFIYDLILDGKKCITKLSDSDKEVAAALMIEGHDKYSAYEFIGEADNSYEVPFFLAKYMKTKRKEDGQMLLDLLVDNAVKYAGNRIVDTLLEQEEEYESDMKYELRYGNSDI